MDSMVGFVAVVQRIEFFHITNKLAAQSYSMLSE